MLNLQEAWQSKVLRERGMIGHGKDGVDTLGTPIKFLEEPGQPNFDCAQHGEHTDEILASLGYDQVARDKLHAKGVC